MTLKIFSSIIVNVSVGMGYSQTIIDYENANGSIQKLTIAEFMEHLIADTLSRMLDLNNLLFPLLVWMTYLPSDWRYARNNQRLRNFVQ
jgi:hypothetical protein